MLKKGFIIFVALIMIVCLSACNKDDQKIDAENRFGWHIEAMETPKMKDVEISDEATNQFSSIELIVNNILNDETIKTNFDVVETENVEYLGFPQGKDCVESSMFRKVIKLDSDETDIKIELVAKSKTSKSISNFTVAISTNTQPGNVQDLSFLLVSLIDKEIAPYIANAKDEDIGVDHPAHLIQTIKVENGAYELRREVYDKKVYLSCSNPSVLQTPNKNQTNFLHDEVADVMFFALSDIFKTENALATKDLLRYQDTCSVIANEIVTDDTVVSIKSLNTSTISTSDSKLYQSSIHIDFGNNYMYAGDVFQSFSFTTDGKSELTKDTVIDCDTQIQIFFNEDECIKGDIKSTMLKTIDLLLPSANFSQLEFLSKLESIDLDEKGDYVGEVQYQVLGNVKNGKFRLSPTFDSFELNCE